MRARRREAIPVVRQAAAVCLGYPEREVMATSACCARRLLKRLHVRPRLLSRCSLSGSHPMPRPSRPTTSTSSISLASTASTCRIGPTATPVAEVRSWPRSSSATAAQVFWSTPGRAARLSADGSGVRGDRRPGRWDRIAAAVPEQR